MSASTCPEVSLGSRMKRWEGLFTFHVEPLSYVLIRLDGRAFHTYTRGLDRPFDRDLMSAMDQTLLTLCQEIPGVRLGYTQSDEISLLITDWVHGEPVPGNPTGLRREELWAGGTYAKLVSLSASIAAQAFAAVRFDQGHRKPAVFDSRLFAIGGSDPRGRDAVLDYFRWRQQDAVKNSISMAAHEHFTPRELHGVKSDQKLAMLEEAGKPWSELPMGFRSGRAAYRVRDRRITTYRDKRTGEMRTVEADREPFRVTDVPIHGGDWISDHVPADPS